MVGLPVVGCTTQHMIGTSRQHCFYPTLAPSSTLRTHVRCACPLVPLQMSMLERIQLLASVLCSLDGSPEGSGCN